MNLTGRLDVQPSLSVTGICNHRFYACDARQTGASGILGVIERSESRLDQHDLVDRRSRTTISSVSRRGCNSSVLNQQFPPLLKNAVIETGNGDFVGFIKNSRYGTHSFLRSYGMVSDELSGHRQSNALSIAVE